MLQQEFAARTGYTPTANEYRDIEAAYYNYEGDKDAFCRQWKEDNRGRIADQKRMQRRAAALDMAISTEDFVHWQIHGVCRYHDITPRIAALILEYDSAQRQIAQLGGECRYNRVLPEFVAYAKTFQANE